MFSQPQIPVVGWLGVALPVAEVAAVQVRGRGEEGNVDGGKVLCAFARARDSMVVA